MLDFLKIGTRMSKNGLEVYPDYIVRKKKDLMIRGQDFYAIWDEEAGVWSTDKDRAVELIDKELDNKAADIEKTSGYSPIVLHLSDSSNKQIDSWIHYCKVQMPDVYKPLDETLVFANTPTKKENYSSHRLPYALEPGDISAYEKLMNTLYSEEERRKLEWSIGSIITGDSKKRQKFIVLYGSSGTGKSTFLNIVDKLFEGYTAAFDASSLGSTTNAFALEAFKNNPLVAIQHDGDLSRIEDNTRINSLVSHELMQVNEKHKSLYAMKFNAFLYMGTNKPVRITDTKSGIIRRLIDVSPTGNLMSPREYRATVKQIEYEIGAIAWHCKEVFEEDPDYYEDYMPTTMLGASNDFYNFMLDAYYVFKDQESTTLKEAWDMYKNYVDEAKIPYPYTMRVFKEELKSYFEDYHERDIDENGNRIRSHYTGFIKDKFAEFVPKEPEKKEEKPWLIFEEQKSLLDDMLSDCKAQYTKDDGTPLMAWDNVVSKLKNLDTKKLHYVIPPDNYIVIDFDISENGEKSFHKNLEAALKFPPTYAELSKSGAGIHLHYIYTGDVSELSTVFDDNVEIKVFAGKASLRRKLTKCNNLPMATISSGLPLKEKKTMLNFDGIKDEKHLRALINKHLRKEIFPNTKPSMDMIKNCVDTAYDSGISYDISDMRTAITTFAMSSTNNAKYCLGLCNKIKWVGKDENGEKTIEDAPIVFFDIEIFPNLMIVCWKFKGPGTCTIMYNPKPAEVEKLMQYRLIGYNNLRYDNAMLYYRYLGYEPERLYDLSYRIIKLKQRDAIPRESLNVSYSDVYEFSTDKKSLKMWEVELGLPHDELDWDFDQPLPKELWERAAEYCCHDVEATEKVFDHLVAEWDAHLILSEWAEMSPNATTNNLTTKIIWENPFGRKGELQWRNMGDLSDVSDKVFKNPDGSVDEFTIFDKRNRPLFPGYKFEAGHSSYRGEDPGEGGYVYAEPGIHLWLALLDIASMHPTSAIAEQLFGIYTKNFEAIKKLRVLIKHKDFEAAKAMVPERIRKYLEDPSLAKKLAQALKIAINAVYGLTSAKFANAFRDERNNDNLVAKRGALFMINLKHQVQLRGYTVAHIKTDSIKIANADMDIINFVVSYGKMYGYDFEHEATYEKMCLVNDSVYIAKYASIEACIERYGADYVNSSKEVLSKNKEEGAVWTATGKEFAVPYVFKTLFSHEGIEFKDMCEKKQVNLGNIYLVQTEIEREFIGRVGLFTPITQGGSDLMVLRPNKKGEPAFENVQGATGYKWIQSNRITDELMPYIDKSYYKKLVDASYNKIASYAQQSNVDLEWFMS